MKYVWEPQDVYAGRHVAAHNRSENYIIGYSPGCRDDRFCIVSLSDGMVAQQGLTKEAVAKHLNEAGKRPLTVDPTDWKAADA